MAHIKGSAVKSTVVFLQERLGPEGFSALLKTLPGSDAEVLSSPILLSNWYEFSLLVRLMNACTTKIQCQPGRSVAWEMGRFSAEFGLKTLYRIFFKVADVGFILKKASQVYSTYYDSGEMQLVRSGDKIAVVRVVGFNEPNTLFCDRLLGWMERTVELTGGEQVSMKHPRCLTRGDRFCEFDGSWK